MMPRAFLIRTSERAGQDKMDHIHRQQPQQQDHLHCQRLQPSFLYQLWSAALASSQSFLQHRLPVTSSYQLAPPPVDGAHVPVTSQHGSKNNPFLNSPPLTANVDTNRLYPRMKTVCDVKTTYSSSTGVSSSASSRFSGLSVNNFISNCCDQRRLGDLVPVNSSQFCDKHPTESGTSCRYPLSCLVGCVHVHDGRDTKVIQTSPVSAPVAARFRCAACHKSYSTVGGLSKHREFHCKVLITADQAKCRRPQQTTTTTKDQRCPQCDKAYTSTSALKMHIRTHTLPCRCRLCGKAFSRPWLLQGHVRTHTGEKPFSCPQCQRAFADRSNLRAHLQTHYDVKQYHCQVCRRSFSRMSLLLKHRYGACGLAANAGVTTGAATQLPLKNDQLVKCATGSSRVLALMN